MKKNQELFVPSCCVLGLKPKSSIIAWNQRCYSLWKVPPFLLFYQEKRKLKEGLRTEGFQPIYLLNRKGVIFFF